MKNQTLTMKTLFRSLGIGGLLGMGMVLASADAHAEQLVALTTSNTLLRLDSDDPTELLSQTTVSGLSSGESLQAIDVRPATGQLYGYSSAGQLYTLNAQTGAATALGTAISPVPSGTSFGLDFNPVVDRIRLVSDAAANFRLDPTTGAVAAQDTDLAYASGDVNFGTTPEVTCVAYTNNFAAATSTSLIGVDTALDDLLTIGTAGGSPTSPNTGQLFTLQDVGANSTTDCGFDVSPNSGVAYASFTSTTTGLSSLYKLEMGVPKNLVQLGAIGSGVIVRDIAVIGKEDDAPTVTITRPSASRVSTRAANLNVQGTALDASGVAEVRYRIVRNGQASAYKTVNGTTSWSFRAPLQEGSQRIEVIAVDIFGNTSSADRVTVTRRR